MGFSQLGFGVADQRMSGHLAGGCGSSGTGLGNPRLDCDIERPFATLWAGRRRSDLLANACSVAVRRDGILSAFGSGPRSGLDVQYDLRLLCRTE